MSHIGTRAISILYFGGLSGASITAAYQMANKKTDFCPISARYLAYRRTLVENASSIDSCRVKKISIQEDSHQEKKSQQTEFDGLLYVD